MVDIVVRAKNNHASVARCLLSIRKNTPSRSYRLILSDDGSDPSLGDTYTDLCIRSRFSHGMVTAANMGLGAALNLFDNPFCLLMDASVTIQDGQRSWLVGFVEAMESSSPKTACVGVEMSGVDQNLWFSPHIALFRKSALATIGPFDEQFNPGPWAESDYAVRLRISGYSLGVFDGLQVENHTSDLFAEERAMHYAKNESRFHAKWTTADIERLETSQTTEVVCRT